MPLSLLHQCGHNGNWNQASYLDDSVGSGLILSPVHMARAVVERLPEEVRHNSLFDPQYYLPRSQKKKLNTYEFFPENIAAGFETDNFSMHALESARLCVDFQATQEYKGIIIPTRYIDQMISNFCELQDIYTVHPFVEALSELKPDAPAYLTLVLTSHMIKDEKFRTNILNWVTSFPGIGGIYLIPDCERTTKQVDDVDFLEEMLVMLHQLREIGIDVVLGYQNTEGLLMTLVPGVTITFGSFENTRIFSIDKFLETEDERRGPRARIYLPGLFNWIQLNHAKEIRDSARGIWDQVYVPTEQSEQALGAAVEPYFNQPRLYMHHFIVYEAQVREMRELEPVERYEFLRTRIQAAQECYSELGRMWIDLDKHGRGDFLDSWLNAMNRHWRNYLA
jgi:hypothetical protein